MSEAWPYLESALTTAREHGRALLLIQAERLQHSCWRPQVIGSTLNALFAEVLHRAEDLGLALEAARTQAAWGEAHSAILRRPIKVIRFWLKLAQSLPRMTPALISGSSHSRTSLVHSVRLTCTHSRIDNDSNSL